MDHVPKAQKRLFVGAAWMLSAINRQTRDSLKLVKDAPQSHNEHKDFVGANRCVSPEKQVKLFLKIFKILQLSLP